MLKRYVVELFAPALQLPPNASRYQRILELNRVSQKVKEPLFFKLSQIKECIIIERDATFFSVIIDVPEELTIIIAKFPEVSNIIARNIKR